MKAVVVGSGIVGLCSARSLLADGHEVTVLDDQPERAERCSVGNSGLIVPSHFVPLAAPGMVALGMRLLLRRDGPFGFAWPPSVSWMLRFVRHCTAEHVEASAPHLLAMHRASREEYGRLAHDLGELPIEQKGVLLLFETHREWEHEKAGLTRAERLGVPAHAVSRGEFSRHLPNVDVDAVGGVYFEEDAHLSPHLVQRRLIPWLRERGVRFHFGARATGFRRTGGAMTHVETPSEAHPADLVVLAAGSWSAGLARTVGLRLPLMAGMGHSFTAAQPPQPMATPSILIEARIAVTPMDNGVRFGGTMELGGTSRRPNLRRVEGMKRSIARVFPRFQPDVFAGAPVWRGFRPCSPDGLPYVGRTQAAPNLLVATGHAMMGMSLGPVTGALIADLAAGRPPRLSLDPYDPDRYA